MKKNAQAEKLYWKAIMAVRSGESARAQALLAQSQIKAKKDAK